MVEVGGAWHPSLGIGRCHCWSTMNKDSVVVPRICFLADRDVGSQSHYEYRELWNSQTLVPCSEKQKRRLRSASKRKRATTLSLHNIAWRGCILSTVFLTFGLWLKMRTTVSEGLVNSSETQHTASDCVALSLKSLKTAVHPWMAWLWQRWQWVSVK